jgi:hypothetical protein
VISVLGSSSKGLWIETALRYFDNADNEHPPGWGNSENDERNFSNVGQELAALLELAGPAH